MTKPTDVLADLDELIESLRGSADAEYSTDSASPSPNADMKTLVALTDIRTKFAALVEAAKSVDVGPTISADMPDDAIYTLHAPAKVWRALSSALRSAGQ